MENVENTLIDLLAVNVRILEEIQLLNNRLIEISVATDSIRDELSVYSEFSFASKVEEGLDNIDSSINSVDSTLATLDL